MGFSEPPTGQKPHQNRKDDSRKTNFAFFPEVSSGFSRETILRPSIKSSCQETERSNQDQISSTSNSFLFSLWHWYRDALWGALCYKNSRLSCASKYSRAALELISIGLTSFLLFFAMFMILMFTHNHIPRLDIYNIYTWYIVLCFAFFSTSLSLVSARLIGWLLKSLWFHRLKQAQRIRRQKRHPKRT